jgi:uncharacterized membrane protein
MRTNSKTSADSMFEISKKCLSIFTYLIAALTLASCIISISTNSIYQDGEWANAQWFGQDIVTIALALPLVLISFIKGIKGNNRKWALVFCGVLLYYTYTYSFFMFAANLTFLYLFHLPIYGLSMIGLVIASIGLFNQNAGYSIESRWLKVGIILYLVFISLMISFLWLNDIMAHLFKPDHLSDTPDGEAPLIIYSLDLAIIIPLMITSAISINKNLRWGYILTGIILTKTSTLGFALMAMALSMYSQNLNPDIFLIILWCIIGVIGTMLTILYLKELKIE